MPLMGQSGLQAGVMMQEQQPSMILEAGKFNSINNTIITQSNMMSGI